MTVNRRQFLRVTGGSLLAGVVGTSGLTAAHPGPFEPLGHVDIAGANAVVLSPDGQTAFVAATSGYVTVDVSSPDRPQILAERRELLSDHEDGPFRDIYDAKLDGETLLVVGPANSLPGSPAGVLVVDVSDPANPEERTFHETTYPIHNCSAADGRVYLTANDGGENPVVVLDIETGTELGRWSVVSEDDRWSEVPAPLRAVHDVWVQDDIAYVSLWDAGTWIVDFTDPGDPSALAAIDTGDFDQLTSLSADQERTKLRIPPGNHHSAATDESGDLLGIGKESWAIEVTRADDTTELVGGPSGVDLWDISDPADPTHLSTIDPPENPAPPMTGVWTTAHNFDFHDGFLYTSWYSGGVKRHDVSDPSNPVELAWWRDPERASFWAAQYAYPFADEGVFVASSRGVDGAPPALYTFPDHAGEQRNPPASGTETTTEPTATQATTSGTETTETDSVSRTGVPGFGVGVGAAAFGTAGWLYHRRSRQKRE